METMQETLGSNTKHTSCSMVYVFFDVFLASAINPPLPGQCHSAHRGRRWIFNLVQPGNAKVKEERFIVVSRGR